MGKALSIIIVNYNVSPFLKLCLYSVCRAVENISAEVFVVDNASGDDSVQMVKKTFPDVIVFANKQNKGFSAANNQAIVSSSGDIILLLNPDTIVAEDTFIKLIDFYKNNKETAGVGVKMIDGSGNYLPESKRGLPSSRDFIFRFSGLMKLFPRSRFISRYFMGNIPNDKTAEVPVMAGAFLSFPRAIIEKVGLLDEQFFMYGEDIDLSYRLSAEGKNYYYPEIKIIHFKGESTVKDEHYIDRFYGAMLIFTKKHFFPEYLWLQKKFMTLSINGVKGLLKKLLLLKRSTDDRAGEEIDSVAYYIGSGDWYGDLKNMKGVGEVKAVSSFGEISRNGVKPGVKRNIFIDIKDVSMKEMIAFMESNPGLYRYSFLSPFRDFYLYSSDSRTSGKVVYLK
ncbi:MAG: glycosyltransferase family 2 protein [Chlorobi bacterium]|nr:glycosyltransferase family 2 protein [Chlorobiota bacterium]